MFTRYFLPVLLSLALIVCLFSTMPLLGAEPEEPECELTRSMVVENPQISLSGMTSIAGNEAFVSLFSGLGVADVKRFWNDIIYLDRLTDVIKVNVFLNSPGGDAFSGLALADQIEMAKRLNFTVAIHASGIVASAAVPVFAAGTKGYRYAAPGTIFMVHEAALWKWPGRETASDIRSQNKLMEMLQSEYMKKLAKPYSNLTVKQWIEKEGKTTWFCAEEALRFGLVDKIQ